ncbi:MAG TPA: hypothetical protein VJ276_07980 [Thermoanaerobaculia bacterium]|nr:hypothetical protein [Thermoanaerobaculia bacterium]
MIELTFLNNIDPAVFDQSRDGGAGIDRGDQEQCDATSAGYPGKDTYPNCFHGSTTANIHFHGTHTRHAPIRAACRCATRSIRATSARSPSTC